MAFADFHGVNTPTIANFKLPVSLNAELGRGVCCHLSRAVRAAYHVALKLPHFKSATKHKSSHTPVPQYEYEILLWAVGREAREENII